MTKTTAVLSALLRPMLEARLPAWLTVHWFTSREEALALAPLADIGWFDFNDKADMPPVISAATNLKWLNSIYAGLDGMPLDQLRAQGTIVTNGKGINATTIAEYAVMGMLTVAKGYADVVRAQDRQEWLMDSPGKVELAGSSALIIGTGAIGQQIYRMLVGFGVACGVVSRRGGGGMLGPGDWQASLPDTDWIILAVPATAETDGLFGAAEVAAMKPGATLVNIARGSVVDQDALVARLQRGDINAFLDVTTPEPLPAGHPLWTLPNAHISMHLSGRAQDKMFVRSADRFIENLGRWERGETLEPMVDLAQGY